MRALVARPDSSTPLLIEASSPTPGPGEVLVDVAAAAVNPADPFVVTGAGRQAFGLVGEVGLGYDVAGVVTAVGSDATSIAVGDRVAGLLDDLSAPLRAQAEEAVVPMAALAHVPDGLDLVEAASLPLNTLTAAQGLDLLGAPEGRSLLVTGAAGAVGGHAVALAAELGWKVTGLARTSDEEVVRGLGAESFTTSLPEASHDAVFDAAALQESALAAVRDGGDFLGVLPPVPVASVRNIRVQEVLVHADGPRLAELLRRGAEGRLPVRVARRVPLGEFSRAYDALTSGGQRGRWMLLP